jgi:hypothetical protein
MNKIELKAIIKDTFLLAGYSTPDSIELIVDEMFNKVNDKYNDDEIRYVFRNGAYKKFGDYTGFSCVLFDSWFETFRKSDIREKLFPKLKLEENNAPTPEEQYNISKQYVINAFNEYKSKGRYCDNFNLCYNFLDSYGYLNLTYELKMKYMDMALVALKKKADIDKVERRITGIKFTELMEKIQSGKSGSQVAEAKKIAIEEFFKGLVETETEISDILED